ncbi:hypothetical protein SDRG_13167 [Saprolegnia diclina VS20]|uniref:Protein DPCD n=1 Tax=Saprolegnia diclina (strain VS20) TaxID=1156394 RepID=T0Q6P4_SAPDV|nr:hypothetical protein SDRG_13167 [Saprolegnia diclina VS20]EQC29135.1 hypothetical protein SDRG_13167 [Saprolegnia diclina VS20]|eukprot:XP_008617470.1 hypothetical protein SDRG_13167 [Saprolegnia diclina VS20]
MYRSHSGGNSAVVVAGGRKRLHTTFADGVELVEDYTKDGPPELLVRRWKTTTALGGDGRWEYEIGEPLPAEGRSRDIGLAPSSTQPTFLCREAPAHWEWRVRNLPYPKETYAISIDDDVQTISIRTSNKKYFKRFQIPALVRQNQRLDAAAISFTHESNTLVVRYKKPDAVVAVERQVLRERLHAAGSSEPQCRQQ